MVENKNKLEIFKDAYISGKNKGFNDGIINGFILGFASGFFIFNTINRFKNNKSIK